jgi:hypothetical protein
MPAKEQMMQALDQRTIVIQRAVLDQTAKADAALELLPDPDGGVLTRAKDATTGERAESNGALPTTGSGDQR